MENQDQAQQPTQEQMQQMQQAQQEAAQALMLANPDITFVVSLQEVGMLAAAVRGPIDQYTNLLKKIDAQVTKALSTPTVTQ